MSIENPVLRDRSATERVHQLETEQAKPVGGLSDNDYREQLSNAERQRETVQTSFPINKPLLENLQRVLGFDQKKVEASMDIGIQYFLERHEGQFDQLRKTPVEDWQI